MSAPEERLPPSSPQVGEGRLLSGAEDAFADLLIRRDELAPLRPDLEEVQEALRKLSGIEVERWMSLRNGSARPLRISGGFDVGTAQQALQRCSEAPLTDEEKRGVEHALTMLQSGGVASMLNAAAEALREVFAERTGATASAIEAILPRESPLDMDIPPALALEIMPLTAGLRAARLCGDAEAETSAWASLKVAARGIWELDLRSALSELADKLGRSCPSPGDEEGWTHAGEFLLGCLLRSPAPELAGAAGRPGEPAAYLKAFDAYSRLSLPHLAERAARAATLAQGDHRRALATQARVGELRALAGSVLVRIEGTAGAGEVRRAPGQQTRWQVSWTASEGYSDSAPVGELPLPSELVDALATAGFRTIGELRRVDPLLLFPLPGVGRAGYRQIKEALNTGN